MSNCVSQSAIDQKKFEAINRLKDLIVRLERGELLVVDIEYIETMSHKRGMTVYTEINNTYYYSKRYEDS